MANITARDINRIRSNKGGGGNVSSQNGGSGYNELTRYLQAQEENERRKKEEEEKKEKGNVFHRLGSTVVDALGNVVTGVHKAGEGVYDAAAGIVGGIGGIFSDDFRDGVKKHIAKDHTGNTVQKRFEKWTEGSYLDDNKYGRFAENVFSGVGQMLPAVLVTAATGGAGAPALATMATSAAGTATEEAYNDGAGYYKGLAYGAASGAVEAGTEKLFGGLTKGLYGKGVLDATKKVAPTGIKRIAKGALEEGAEEILSELANPLTKSIYKGTDGVKEYIAPEYWKGVGEAGAVGAATSLLYGSTVGAVMAKAGKGNVGRGADIEGSLEAVKDLEKQAAKLQEERASTETKTDAPAQEQGGKNSSTENPHKRIVVYIPKREGKIAASIKKNYENIQKTLQDAKPEKREKLIKKFGLESYFNEDGTMNDRLTAKLDGQANWTLASPKNGLYSYGLVGEEQSIQDDLALFAEERAQKYAADAQERGENMTIEGARERVGKFEVSEGALSEKGDANFQKFRKAFNVLNEGTGASNYVVVKENDSFNGVTHNGRIYIGADQFENGDWVKTLIHEYTHLEEGTKEYEAMVDELFYGKYAVDVQTADGVEKASLWSVATEAVGRKGYVSPERLSKVLEKKSAGEVMTKQEIEIYQLYRSEVVAHETEILLGNEQFIDKIAKEKPNEFLGLVKKIFTLNKAFKQSGMAKAEYKQLQKAERLYLAAAEKAGNARLLGQVQALREEEEEVAQTTDGGTMPKFSLKEIEGETVVVIDTDQDIFEGVEDAKELRKIAREYIMSHFRENAYNTNDNKSVIFTRKGAKKITNTEYPVKIKISTELDNFIKAAEYSHTAQNEKNSNPEFDCYDYYNVKFILDGRDFAATINVGINNQEGFGVFYEVSNIKETSHNSFGNDKVASPASNDISTNSIRKQNEKVNSFSENSSKNVKYSLKDSEGRGLSQEQAKFFENSKVRDKEGNLQVVYHGTEGVFYVYDKALRGSNTGAEDAQLGFFFTDSIDVAKEYAIYTQDRKVLSLMHQIAQGNTDLLSNYDYEYLEKHSAHPEMVEDFKNLVEKSERGDNDIQELYLNIENPLETDWKYKPYKKGDMLKAVTKAMLGGHDGLIIRNIDDSIDQTGEFNDVFVVFEPEQIKLTTNKKPTKNTDIRYSVKEGIDNSSEKGYSSKEKAYTKKRSYYNQYDTIAMQWAFSSKTKSGDVKVLYNAKDNTWNKLVADDSEERYGVQLSIKDTPQNAQAIIDLHNEVYNENNEEQQGTRESLHTSIERYRSRSNDLGDDMLDVEKQVAVRRGGELHREDSEGDGKRNPRKGNGNPQYSVKEDLSGKSTSTINRPLEDAVNAFFIGHTGKAYTKAEALEVIYEVLDDVLVLRDGDHFGNLKGKNKREVTDMLWRGLNTASISERRKVAEEVAEYVINNAIVESVFDDNLSSMHTETIERLKPYFHRINLDGIKADIRHRYGEDNRPFLLWGNREGRGADVVAQELAEKGFTFASDNPAEIFMQIHDAYMEAREFFKQGEQALLEGVSVDERAQLAVDIRKKVLAAFDEKGGKTKLFNILEYYEDKARSQKEYWKEKYYDAKARDKIVNSVREKVKKITEFKKGIFFNSTQYKSKDFREIFGALSKIIYRGNLNERGTRNVIKQFDDWYDKKAIPALEGFYSEEVKEMLSTISKGEGRLTTTEIVYLDKITSHALHIIENCDKVYRNGEYVDAVPLAQEYVDTMKENKEVRVGWISKVIGAIFNGEHSFLETFGDPRSIMRMMDKYAKHGFYTEMYEAIATGELNAKVREMELLEPIERFLKKKGNQKLAQECFDKTVTYRGKQIPLGVAMSIYATLKQDAALFGWASSGIAYDNVKGKKVIGINKIEGIDPQTEKRLEEIRPLAEQAMDELYGQFSDNVKELVDIGIKLLNTECRAAKRITDIKRQGYSLLEADGAEGYFPLIRYLTDTKIAKSKNYLQEVNFAANQSFNKERVKNARQALYIQDFLTVIYRHVKGIALYENLAMPIDNYYKLYHLDVGGDLNSPVSVKSTNQEGVYTWKHGEEYMEKLIHDVQGLPVSEDGGFALLRFYRSNYAKFQLGLNPQTWVKQLSSLAASTNLLGEGSLLKGVASFLKAGKSRWGDVDKYCKLAKLRNHENTAALAEGVLDKVGKVSDIFMKPIGWVDRFVVQIEFYACQHKIAKNGGAKVGTEENLVAAGALLERVLRETQQNTLAAEKVGAARSSSELLKGSTMFKSDTLKGFGRVIDGFGECAVWNAKIKLAKKNGLSAAEIAEMKKGRGKAVKKTFRAVSALTSTAVFMAIISQAFRHLYGKHDDDEKIALDMTIDLFGNMLGGLPVIDDVYSYFLQGYDINHYAIEGLNSFLESVANVCKLCDGQNSTQEIAKAVRSMLYSAGQFTGMPIRNVYNFFTGLIRRFSPTTGYKIDSTFYNQSYRKDLAKAIENNDEKMIATIAGLMLDENIGGIDDSKARKEMDALIGKGFDVIPRSVGDTITYNGEEYELSSKQRKVFERVYSVANTALASLVRLKEYKDSSDEVKAKAVNFIYKTYYNLAIQDTFDIDIETKSVLFAEAMDIEKLALVISAANNLSADFDEDGKAIQGTKKTKVQKYVSSLKLSAAEKYMIMGYLGYKNIHGKEQVKAYINRLKLTKEEKEKLLEYSGY